MNEILIKYIEKFGPLYLPKGVSFNDPLMIKLMEKAIKRNSEIEEKEIWELYDNKIDLINYNSLLKK